MNVSFKVGAGTQEKDKNTDLPVVHGVQQDGSTLWWPKDCDASNSVITCFSHCFARILVLWPSESDLEKEQLNLYKH